MTHNNDHDFQQFRGQFDDAMIPDASFKAKMEKLLQSEKPVEADRRSTVLASPPRKQSETVVPGRRSHPLMVAIAVLTVFAVAITSVWVLSGDVLEGEYAGAPSGIATLPADAEGTPGPDVQLTAEQIPAISQVHQYFGMHGGLLIIRGPVALTENQTNPGEAEHALSQEPNVNSDVLMAIDPETGESIWEQPYHGFDAVGASNNVLVGTQADWSVSTPDGHPYRKIVALNLTTGEEIWTSTGSPTNSWSSYPGIVVLDGVVVDTTSSTTMTGYNIHDGSLKWETEYDPGEGWLQQYTSADGETRNEQRYLVATTVWNGTMVIINGDGLVQLIEPESGERTTTHQFDWTEVEITANNNIELHAMDDGVVLFQLMSEKDGLRSRLTAFDPADGTYFWHLDVDGQQFVDAAGNGNVALQSVTWEPSNWFQRLFGDHGDSIRSLTWINGNSGEVRMTTEPGVVNDGSPAAETDGTYACSRTGQAEIICYDTTGTRYILEIEPFYGFDLIDGVLHVPTEEGMFRADLP